MIDKSFESYANSDLRKYSGKWVVFIGGKVVGSGKNVKKLLKKVEKEYPSEIPMVARVPEKVLQIL